MKMMKAAVALGMALTMTVTGASAVFAEGETLSVATDFEVKTLVPWAASEENAFMVLNQAEEGLFRMDENNQPQPALCDTYEVTDDKLTYTFHLRDGIQWSNGEPVTAADLHAVGSMAALLKDALKPNMIQTLEHTPALVHGGLCMAETDER